MTRLLLFFTACQLCAATYYVNPATGADSNSGLSPALAWKTAGKINGFSFAYGDILAIEAPSNAPLDLSATNLTLASHGLTVKATNGQYWHAKLWQTLTNAHFTAAGPANVYQIPLFNNASFTQQHIVVWEDDVWMWHPNGATWASVSNYVCTNAGSFWTDGATLYVHPFNDSNPATDGKVYTRSVARDPTGFLSAILLHATNIYFSDCYAGKTCMARSTDGDGLAAYVLGTLGAFAGVSVVSNCYLYYGSKHVIGFTSTADNSDLTVIDCVAEQSTAYGSSSAWVSYMSSGASTNNVHRYLRCRTDAPIGKPGSRLGQQTVQDVMLSHNNGSGVQFRELTFSNCIINGIVGLSVCSNAILVDSIVGGFRPAAVVSNICERVKMHGIGLDLQYNGASNTLVRNVITVHTNQVVGGIWNGWLLQGNVLLENNTFDFYGVSNTWAGATVGLLKRQGALTLICRNNAMKFGGNNNCPFAYFTTNDTYSISNNVYQLGPSNMMAYFYTNSSGASDRSFLAWQALGFDANSATNTTLSLRSDNYYPMLGSPVIDAGVNTGPMTDYSGVSYATRNDAGAWEFVPPAAVFQGVTLQGVTIR